jgi:hypothetical protein
VRLLFFVYVVRDVSDACALVFLNFIGIDGLSMDGWYSLGFYDHFRILFGLFTCLSW